MGSETLPSACYILSDESSIPFYSTSNGYKNYNLRRHEVSYTVGQEIYRRNFQQSKFVKGFNAKLAPVFVKARIRRKLGSAHYELEDLQGKRVGKYHAKDIKQ